MYHNIGKKIHILAIILAAISFAGFLTAAVIFLVAAFKAEAGTTVRAAGFEGAGLFFVLALLSPLFSWVLYGFGSLVDASERQAEQEKEIRDLLKKALSEGALSDEISRKLGNSLSKLTLAAAPSPRTGVAPTRPVVRGSARQTPPAPVMPQEPVFDPAPEPSAKAEPEGSPTAQTPAAATPAKAPAPAGASAQGKPAGSFEEPAAPERPAITFTAPSAAKRPAPATPATADSDGTEGSVAPVRPLHSDTTY